MKKRKTYRAPDIHLIRNEYISILAGSMTGTTEEVTEEDLDDFVDKKPQGSTEKIVEENLWDN